MSTISNLPISQSLLLKGLSLPNKMAMVYSQDYGYNVLTQLTSKLASSISTPQSKVEISSLGNLGVYSKIVTNAAAGSGMLNVSVSDASKFRISDIVADGNLVQAIVVNVDTAGNVLSYDDLTLKAFAKQLEYKYAFSERQIKQGPYGEYYTTGGLRWSIINNGGSYLSLTSELTQSVFNDFLEQMVRVSAEGGRKLVALMGSSAMARLQTVLGDYIKFAGTANTFGGTSVTGLNVMKYAYAGLEIEFVRWALLDDEMFRGELSTINGKPRMSNSIYFIDTTAVPAADGSGNIAALQKYHFNSDELLANYVPGMIGLDSSDPSSVKAALSGGQSVSLGTSDVDGVDFHILSDCGLYCIADKMGLIEFAI